MLPLPMQHAVQLRARNALIVAGDLIKRFVCWKSWDNLSTDLRKDKVEGIIIFFFFWNNPQKTDFYIHMDSGLPFYLLKKNRVCMSLYNDIDRRYKAEQVCLVVVCLNTTRNKYFSHTYTCMEYIKYTHIYVSLGLQG